VPHWRVVPWFPLLPEFAAANQRAFGACEEGVPPSSGGCWECRLHESGEEGSPYVPCPFKIRCPSAAMPPGAHVELVIRAAWATPVNEIAIDVEQSDVVTSWAQGLFDFRYPLWQDGLPPVLLPAGEAWTMSVGTPGWPHGLFQMQALSAYRFRLHVQVLGDGEPDPRYENYWAEVAETACVW
jgi:hypothetical protein